MTTLLFVTTFASIGLLTAIAWALRRAVLPRLCPLCAGVAGTWIGLLVAHRLGVAVDPRLPAVLLGGSVVGLAGLGERALAGRSPTSVLLWKTAFVLVGFATAYALLLGAWLGAVGGGVVLAGMLGAPWLGRATAQGAAPPVQVRPGGPALAPEGAGERREALLAQLNNCC
ncbi:MAG TPA: hypothetical protein VKB51_00860 [bacterium]|nr:hypothetical protein [bacterium]